MDCQHQDTEFCVRIVIGHGVYMDIAHMRNKFRALNEESSAQVGDLLPPKVPTLLFIMELYCAQCQNPIPTGYCHTIDKDGKVTWHHAI